jgi:shikimate kinase
MTAAKGFAGVVLVGFMGSGKSSVGRELARRIGAEFVDVDSWIENKASCPIRVLFEREGEPAFREREKSALKEILSEKGRVVATGGGAFLDEGNRKLLKEYGPVVYLEVEADTVLRRLEKDARRPLLHCDDREAVVRDLLDRRIPGYRQADHAVSTEGRTVEEIAERIAELIKTREGGCS